MSFKISNNLQSGTNLSRVVYANQQADLNDNLNDEIAFYKDGILTSSPDLKYDGTSIQTSAAISMGTFVQTNAPPGRDGGFVRAESDGAAQYINMGTTATTAAGPGAGSRIVSLTAGGDPAKKDLRLQTKDGTIFLQAPVRIGSDRAPPCKLDHGVKPLTPGVNLVTTIQFTANLFTGPPTVVCVANTPASSTSEQFVHVENVTATSFDVEYYQVCAPGTFVNYIACGI